MRLHALVFAFALCVLAATAQATVVVVDHAGGGDFLTIQEGVDAASLGDTVQVAPGTYTGPGNRNITYAGKEVHLISRDGPEATVIDCENLDRAFVFEGTESPDAIVEGFTITRGLAPLNAQNQRWGGAMYIANSMPTILDCTFIDNNAEYGGALYCGVSALTEIVYCKFEGNEAMWYGGSIYTYGANVYVAKCDFDGNEASISGGGICCKTGSLAIIADCDFTDNYAGDGGAIYIGTHDGSSEPEFPSEVNFCHFTHNSANRGGALFINGFTWVQNYYCVYDYNTAVLNGGAVFALTDYTRSLAIDHCTFVFNGAEHGGGVYSAGSFGFEMQVTQSIFAFGTGGGAVQAEDYNAVSPSLCVAFENVGGDELVGSRNLQEDPLFCDVYAGNYYLCENSLCLPDNHPYGSWSVGRYTAPSSVCDACASPVRETSWGAIKSMFR